MVDRERKRELERKRRAADPEKYREKARKKYWANKESENERARKYHAENREALLAKKKKWYQENKDKIDKEAQKARARAYYLDHPEKWFKKDAATREEIAKFREEHRAKEKERKRLIKEAREARMSHPNWSKEKRLKSYGIDYDQFQSLLDAQGNKCAICGYSDMSNPKIFPFVDHCHNLNHVRGILCCHCNHALGHMKDSPVLLRKAAKYLERSALFGPPETNRESENVQ
jgi:hypothetical protein